MTSKSLCFKLMREDLKRRMWTIALTVLGFVFTLLVPVALRSSAYLDRVREGWELREREWMIRQLVGMVGINGLVIAVLLAVAVVWAMSGFLSQRSRKAASAVSGFVFERDIGSHGYLSFGPGSVRGPGPSDRHWQ